MIIIIIINNNILIQKIIIFAFKNINYTETSSILFVLVKIILYKIVIVILTCNDYFLLNSKNDKNIWIGEISYPPTTKSEFSIKNNQE